MPVTLHHREFEPVENRRKSRIIEGGLGHPNGPQEAKRYFCCKCHKEYKWSNDLDFTDFGDVIDNLCGDCRVILRTMRTNHPMMKG